MRIAVVLVTLLGLVPSASIAQFRPAPPSGSPFPPNGPATRTNPSPRLNQALPDPFASRVPNPIMRPAAPRTRPSGPGMPQPQVPGQGMSGPRDVFRAAPWTYAPRYGRLSALRGSGYYGGYVDGGYAPYFYADTVPNDQAPVSQGRLGLCVSPLSSQVFVDGFYVGTAGDFQGSRTLARTGSAPHRALADGYETATFDVRILEDQTVNYEGTWRERRPAQKRHASPRCPRRFTLFQGVTRVISRPLPSGSRAGAWLGTSGRSRPF